MTARAKAEGRYLAINRCPLHANFWSVSVEEHDGSGTRLTPSKCCGQWKTVTRWLLTEQDWQEVMRIADDAREDSVTT